MTYTFEQLLALENSWDGEGAPAPTASAVEEASAFVDRLGDRVLDVDADVIGGVSVTYVDNQGARWWASFMNDGRFGTTRIQP